MGPHREWIENLRRGGVSCCDMGDCRPVSARIVGDRWQVRWRQGQLPTAPLHWTDVPRDVVLTAPNPVGVAVACWNAGRVLCFVPPVQN